MNRNPAFAVALPNEVMLGEVNNFDHVHFIASSLNFYGREQADLLAIHEARSCNADVQSQMMAAGCAFVLLHKFGVEV